MFRIFHLRFCFHKFMESKKYSMTSNTIYALSSAYGKCGVAVIRVSGPQAEKALRILVRHEKSEMFKQRYAILRSLYHPKTKNMIDKGLILWFPAPASFTGEDCCEFQVHGSLAVIAALLDALGQINGLRPAMPGEFTKRAFFSNKLNLTEVEGLADLIQAETEAQRKQALLQSNGVLSRLYDDWRQSLLRCNAHLEAFIDFSEDESIKIDVISQLTKELKIVYKAIKKHLNDKRQGELLRDGVRAAIVGAPNVGKSSFLNLLCQRSVSIVTDIAGTTRDVIESMQNIGGYPIRLYDTAGLRHTTNDVVELEGITRAKQCLLQSNLILLLIDGNELINRQIFTSQQLKIYLYSYLQSLDLNIENIYQNDKHLILIANKIDLLTEKESKQIQSIPELICISCKDQINIQHLLEHLETQLKYLCGNPLPEAPRLTQARHRQQLEQCVIHLEKFLFEYSPEYYPDLAISSQKLRQAIKCIERITGRVTSDDILNIIFKDFCIGK